MIRGWGRGYCVKVAAAPLAQQFKLKLGAAKRLFLVLGSSFFVGRVAGRQLRCRNGEF
jgi:hypothetical protein